MPTSNAIEVPVKMLNLMARLAALVPPPRMHLTRYHGVFAPHSKLRAAVTPAHRGTGAARQPPAFPAKPPTPRHVAMNWARRLKRVFGVEIEGCARCGGKLKIIASIEEPQVIAKILSHLERMAPQQYPTELPLSGRLPVLRGFQATRPPALPGKACRRQDRAHHEARSANKDRPGLPV